MADEPTARSSPISPAAGIVLSAAPGDVRRRVEAVALGGGDEALGAELDAERGEDRVARLARRRRRACRRSTRRWRSRGRRPPARPSCWTGIGLLRVGDPGLERARRRDHLERRPGRLQAREGDPGEGEHLAGARARAPRRRPGAPPSAVTAACSTGSEIVVRTAGAWRGLVRLSTRAPATSSPPGRAEQALVEDPLEARDADLGVGGHAERGELRRGARAGSGPSWPTTCGASSERRGAVVALGQHGAVAGQQRGARGHPRHAAQALAGREPGEDERARPVDAVARRRAGRPRRATVPNARVGMRTGHAVGARRPCAAWPCRPSPPSRCCSASW